MATYIHPQPPPRTPSPKIRFHRSQSFDSPSSRISVTPIDDSPYSKSASAIVAKPLPRYDALKAAEQSNSILMGRQKVMLHTTMSEDSIMSETSDASSEGSPVSEASDTQYGLFASGSPAMLPQSEPASPLPLPHRYHINTTPLPYQPLDSSSSGSPSSPPVVFESSVQMLQFHETSASMFDPWLVRLVLDLYDVRGFDWFMIAEPIERIWEFKTSSAEVLDILSSNGRLGRCWWD